MTYPTVHFFVAIPLALSPFDLLEIALVVHPDRLLVGPAFINVDELWHAIVANSLDQELLGRAFVPSLCQKEINCMSLLIHCTVQIHPSALDLDVCLIHSPSQTNSFASCSEAAFDQKRELEHPTLQSCMIYIYTANLKKFLNVTIA